MSVSYFSYRGKILDNRITRVTWSGVRKKLKFNESFCADPMVDLGGGGGADTLLQGFDPLQPKGSPPCTVLRYPYLAMDPKIFLEAPRAPVYTNFEGGARAEKTRFYGRNFPKSAQKRLFGFFLNSNAAQKIWSK